MDRDGRMTSFWSEESQTYASAEHKANTTILQAQAELLGAKREGYLMAEMAVRHHTTMTIMNN